MNQEKIGQFIALLRKEKNMTQRCLAEKLGVTDRAISKWENGRGMPDLSLIKPLCIILDISINELLSGERLDRKKYHDKLEENILNTIDYTDKKIKKTKKVFKFILTLCLVLIGSIVIMFVVDVNRMRHNKPVLFSTWGYSYSPAFDLHEEEISLAIEEYLMNKFNDNIKSNNEKWFVSFQSYLLKEKNRESLYYVYTWVLAESYYLETDKVIKNGGVSVPYKFVVKKQSNNYVVIESKSPRDGSLYHEDMQEIFPWSVRLDMNKFYDDGTYQKLQLNIQKQVRLYYRLDD